MIRTLLCLALCLTAVPALVSAATPNEQTERQSSVAKRTFILEDIEIHGLEGTDRAKVLDTLDLDIGETMDQSTLVEAVAALKAAGLFERVDDYTRPGSERGRIILVLEIVDRKPRGSDISMRMGAGNSDNDGWYWIPLQLDFGKVGHENTNFGARFALGYRFTELSATLRRNFGPRQRSWWGVTAATRNSRRYYVLDGLEVDHGVGRDFIGLDIGQHLASRWTLVAQFRKETATPDPYARYADTSEFRGVDDGENIPLLDLPDDIQAVIGRSERLVFDGALAYDARHQQQIAFSPTGGLWAGLRFRSTHEHGTSTPMVSLDVRSYRSMLGGVMSWRARGAVTGDEAPFYDRLYLGGLYTVRGVPSHGLTEPGGGTWLWNSSLEFRAPLSGDAAKPRLAGSVFVDVGQSEAAVQPDGRDLAASLGWGLRWRLFGIILGADLAVPVTGSPVEELFHGNMSIGWSF